MHHDSLGSFVKCRFLELLCRTRIPTFQRRHTLDLPGIVSSLWFVGIDHPWSVRENDTLRNCVQQSEVINPLEPRDAFYGGRPEAFTLFQKDQDISYVDVTSLYPYINKTGKIPTYPFSNAFFNSSVTHVPVNDLCSSLC
jgi:hypothetical protein